jgi:uncharacterized cupredoxin-like copper-binding protein
MSPLKSALALAAVSLALAGCGEDKKGSVNIKDAGTSTTGTTEGATTPTATAPTGAPVATIKLTETDFKLDPRDPKVAKAGIVVIDATNAGQVPHAIEVHGPAGEAKSGTIAPGKKTALKVDLSKDGSYEWYCPVGDHKDRGMKGTITVGKGGATTTTDDSGGNSSSGGY